MLAQAVINHWYDTVVELKEMRVKMTRIGSVSRNATCSCWCCRGLF